MSKRRRGYPSSEQETEVDLIPMMDLALNLTFFFVVLTTLAKDELARGIHLPLSSVAVASEEAKLPNSISINVRSDGQVLSWGEKLSLRTPADVKRLDALLANEAAIARKNDPASAAGPIATTVIFRIDSDADCEDFQTLIDRCRERGFTKFVLRSRVEP